MEHDDSLKRHSSIKNTTSPSEPHSESNLDSSILLTLTNPSSTTSIAQTPSIPSNPNNPNNPSRKSAKRSNSTSSLSSLLATGFSISHPKSSIPPISTNSTNPPATSTSTITESWPATANKEASSPSSSLKRFDSFCSVQAGKIVADAAAAANHNYSGKSHPNECGGILGNRNLARKQSEDLIALAKGAEYGEKQGSGDTDKVGAAFIPSSSISSASPTSNPIEFNHVPSELYIKEANPLPQPQPAQPLRPQAASRGASYHSSTTDQSEMTTRISTLQSDHRRSKSQYSSISSSSSYKPFVAHNKRISFSRDVRNGNSPAPKLMLPPQFNLAMQQEMEEQKKQQEERERLQPSNIGGRGGNGRNKLGLRFRRPKTAPASTSSTSTSSSLSSSSSSLNPSLSVQSGDVEEKETTRSSTSSVSQDKPMPPSRPLEREPSETSGSEVQEFIGSAPISRSNSSTVDAFGPIAFCQSRRESSGPQSKTTLGPTPLSVSPLTNQVELPPPDSAAVRSNLFTSTEPDMEGVTSILGNGNGEKNEAQSGRQESLPIGNLLEPRVKQAKRPSSAGAGNGTTRGYGPRSSNHWTAELGGGGRKRVSSDASSIGDASLRSLPTRLPIKPFDDGRISHTKLESLPPPPRAFYPGTLILVRDRKSSSSDGSDSASGSEGSSACTDDEDDANDGSQSHTEQAQGGGPNPTQISETKHSPVGLLSIPSKSSDDNAAQSSSTLSSPTTLLTPRVSSSSDDEDAGSATSMDSNLRVEIPPIEPAVQFAELVPTTSHPRSPGGRKILWDNEVPRTAPLLNAPPAPPIARKESAARHPVDGQEERQADSSTVEQIRKKPNQSSAVNRFKKAGKAIRAAIRILGSGHGNKEMESKRVREKRERSMSKSPEAEERLYDEDGNVNSWKQGPPINKETQEEQASQAVPVLGDNPATSTALPAPSSSSKRLLTKSLTFSKSMRSKAAKFLNHDKYERTSSMRIVSSRDLGTVNSILLSPISSMHGGAHIKARSAGYDEFGALKMRDQDGNQLGSIVGETDRPTFALSLPSSASIHGPSRSNSMPHNGIPNSPSVFSPSPSHPRPTAFELPLPTQQQNGRPRSHRTSTSRASSRRGSAQSNKGIAQQKVQIQAPTEIKLKEKVHREDEGLKKVSTKESMRGSHEVEGGAEHYL